MSKAQLQAQMAAIHALPKTDIVKVARVRASMLEAISEELANTPDDPVPDHSFTLARLDTQLAALPDANVEDQESLRLRFVIQRDIIALGGSATDPVVIKTVTGKTAHYSIAETPAQIAADAKLPAAPVVLNQSDAKKKAIATLQAQVDALKASM